MHFDEIWQMAIKEKVKPLSYIDAAFRYFLIVKFEFSSKKIFNFNLI